MDHRFKTSSNFHNFYPYTPPVGSFLLLSVGKFGQFVTPPPKKCRRLKWMKRSSKKYESIKAFLPTVGLQLEISNLEQTLGLFF